MLDFFDPHVQSILGSGARARSQLINVFSPWRRQGERNRDQIGMSPQLPADFEVINTASNSPWKTCVMFSVHRASRSSTFFVPQGLKNVVSPYSLSPFDCFINDVVHGLQCSCSVKPDVTTFFLPRNPHNPGHQIHFTPAQDFKGAVSTRSTRFVTLCTLSADFFARTS